MACRFSYAQQSATDFPVLTGPYLGQKPPGKIAEPFAQDIIAAQHHFHGSVVFSPDGKEAYWSVMNNVRIMFSKRGSQIWRKPELFMPDSDVPFISPDGNKLFFMAQKVDQGKKTEVISVMDRTPTGWSKAYALPDIVHSIPIIHWQISVDKKGNLYFGGKQNGSKSSRTYCSEYVDGTYLAPKMIEELKEFESFSPFVAPDGSYLIVTAFREELGLYILFRKADGTWTSAKSISTHIGATGEMLCPIVSPDGKYLFLLKGVGERTLPYWVDASFIEELRRAELSGEKKR